MKRTVLILGLIFAGCTDEDASLKTLRGAGFKDVVFLGHDFGACSDSDFSCTEFEATGPTGQRVHGAVGCGFWLKGCTIRFE